MWYKSVPNLLEISFILYEARLHVNTFGGYLPTDLKQSL